MIIIYICTNILFNLIFFIMATSIKDLKVGDYFKFRLNGRVYVRGNFDRSSKRYSYYDFNDSYAEHFCSGSKEVIVDLNDEDFVK